MTHADIVKLEARSREFESGTDTLPVEPSKDRAPPDIPVVLVTPPISVPVLPRPEESVADVPDVSSNLYHAIGLVEVTVPTVTIALCVAVPPAPVHERVYVVFDVGETD